jgi:hypothetical protein
VLPPEPLEDRLGGEPIGLVDDAVLVAVGRPEEEVAAGDAEPLDDGEQIARPPDGIEEVQGHDALEPTGGERRIEGVGAHEEGVAGGDPAGAHGQVRAAVIAAGVADLFAREQAAGTAEGREAQVDPDGERRAAGDFGHRAACAGPELEGAVDLPAAQVGDGGEERGEPGGGEAPGGDARRRGPIPPVGVEVDGEVLEDAREAVLLGGGLDEQRLQAGIEVALDEGDGLAAEEARGIGDQDGDAVDDGVARRARAAAEHPVEDGGVVAPEDLGDGHGVEARPVGGDLAAPQTDQRHAVGGVDAHRGALYCEHVRSAELRRLIDGAFARTVAGRPGLALPPTIRETIVGVALRNGGEIPGELAEYYTRRSPALLVEQLDRPGLLGRPLALARMPRLAAALAELHWIAPGLTGATDGPALLAERPTMASVHAGTLFGAGLPLLGAALPVERGVLEADLGAGRDPDEVLDHRLSGNLVHELCHGLPREADEPPPPWHLLEAAAIHVGLAAFPRHVFPDEPGEAVPGASLFVLLAEGLARRVGRASLWRLSAGVPLREAFGPRVARVLEAAAWQEWPRKRQPVFAADALEAESWVKLADAALGACAPLDELVEAADERGPPLLPAAERVPWSELPWWREHPSPADEAMVEVGVRALFQDNRLAPNYQTHPSELPDDTLVLEVAACRLRAARRPEGVFGEPARWLFPPPLARRLAERGCARVVVEGTRRSRWREIGEALVALARGGEALRGEVRL